MRGSDLQEFLLTARPIHGVTPRFNRKRCNEIWRGENNCSPKPSRAIRTSQWLTPSWGLCSGCKLDTRITNSPRESACTRSQFRVGKYAARLDADVPGRMRRCDPSRREKPAAEPARSEYKHSL